MAVTQGKLSWLNSKQTYKLCICIERLKKMKTPQSGEGGQGRRQSASLSTVQFGFRTPVWARDLLFYTPVQTDPGGFTQPPVKLTGLFSRVKRGADTPTPPLLRALKACHRENFTVLRPSGQPLLGPITDSATSQSKMLETRIRKRRIIQNKGHLYFRFTFSGSAGCVCTVTMLNSCLLCQRQTGGIETVLRIREIFFV